MSLADLAETRSRVGRSFVYRPRRQSASTNCPPNGQALTSLLALAILAELGLAQLEPDAPDSIHLQIEAMKAAFAQCRRHLADPDAMSSSADRLLEPSAVRALAGKIRRDRAAVPGPPPPADEGTVYLATGDADGRMVSLIQSNYLGFGSGVVVPGTGISMHNRGLGFQLDANHPSCVAGGKRPFHTIIVLTSSPATAARKWHSESSAGTRSHRSHVPIVLRSFVYGEATRRPATRPLPVRDRPLRGRARSSPRFRAWPTSWRERGHRLVKEITQALLFGGMIVRRLARGYCSASQTRANGRALGS